jgi:class 3 adenylate cyclase
MRVERYFAFVDLCGFTQFTDTHGDDAAVRILTRFRSVIRETSSDHGVRIAKWLGDGAMFVSTAGVPLVETIVDLTRRIDGVDLPLLVRAGMSSGEVILFEGDDYIGGAVNLASRLCDLAEPRELLASAEMSSMVPALVPVAEVGSLEVPGFVHSIDVIRLGPAPVSDPA